MDTHTYKPTLVVGGTGKTGRRVADRLEARGVRVRIGSRSGEPPFWENASTWAPALLGAGAAYVFFFPDLAVPGAAAASDATATGRPVAFVPVPRDAYAAAAP